MSWVTSIEADTYFATRLGASKFWKDDTGKDAALVTAQSMLEASGEFSFPADATTAMKNAVCEQALFILRDPDWEVRCSLKAQGVSTAWIVKEAYRAGNEDIIPIAPLARGKLAEHSIGRGGAIYTVDLGRRPF